MVTTVNVHEAKTHLSRLLNRVATGEEITMAKAGRAIARLVPMATSPESRRLGMGEGKIRIAEDFDEELPEKILQDFEG